MGLPKRVAVCAVLSLLCLGRLSADDAYYDGRGKDCSTTIKGARSYITTGPLPLLHGGAFSCVWAMACRDDVSRYVQAGHTRDSGESTFERFAQWRDDNGVRWEKKDTAPGSGLHQYECYYGGSTAQWSFRYDGVEFANSKSHPATWTAGYAQFSGEVSPTKAVQMMGREEMKVTFYMPEVFVPGCGGGGSWQDIWPDVYKNDDPGQWKQIPNQTYGFFDIWDETP